MHSSNSCKKAPVKTPFPKPDPMSTKTPPGLLKTVVKVLHFSKISAIEVYSLNEIYLLLLHMSGFTKLCFSQLSLILKWSGIKNNYLSKGTWKCLSNLIENLLSQMYY